jgi:hypothetical protein
MTITDANQDSDFYALMGQAWVENQIQIAPCEADIYPQSSEDIEDEPFVTGGGQARRRACAKKN